VYGPSTRDLYKIITRQTDEDSGDTPRAAADAAVRIFVAAYDVLSTVRFLSALDDACARPALVCSPLYQTPDDVLRAAGMDPSLAYQTALNFCWYGRASACNERAKRIAEARERIDLALDSDYATHGGPTPERELETLRGWLTEAMQTLWRMSDRPADQLLIKDAFGSMFPSGER
jgi:hypothetical protein